MKPEEADTLAKRIINTFRQTPALTEWRDVLTNLDHTRATNAFTHCRNNIDGPLTIKRYLDAYSATQDTYGWQPPPDTGPPISLNEYLHRHPEDTHLFAQVKT